MQPYGQPRPVRTQQPRTSRPPPANYNGARTSAQEAGNTPYRRVSLSRARSLSRPERQRPRPGMLRDHSRGEMEYRPSPSPGPGRPLGPAEQQRRMRQQMQQMNIQRQSTLPPQAGAANSPLPTLPPTGLQRTQTATTVKKVNQQQDRVVRGWWGWTARIATCCFPNWFIKSCLRKPNAQMQQAWREKLTLVYIIIFCCLALSFITVGLNRVLCPAVRITYPYSQSFEGQQEKVYRENVTIYGQIYPFSVAKSFFAANGLNLTNDYQNTDMSGIFDGDTTGACKVYDAGQAVSSLGTCRVNDPYGGWIQKPDGTCLSLASLQQYYQSTASLSYDWIDLQPLGVDLLGDSPLLIYGDTGKSPLLSISSKLIHSDQQYLSL